MRAMATRRFNRPTRRPRGRRASYRAVTARLRARTRTARHSPAINSAGGTRSLLLPTASGLLSLVVYATWGRVKRSSVGGVGLRARATAPGDVSAPWPLLRGLPRRGGDPARGPEVG